MVFKIGYDNTDSDNRFYARYKNKYYTELVSKMLGEKKRINRFLEVEFAKVNSAFGEKYVLEFRNIFFFRFYNTKRIFSLDLEIADSKKMLKLVNYDIFPSLTLSLKNECLPLTLSMEYGNMQSSRNQIFDGNEFSKVVKSLLPFRFYSCSLDHGRSIGLNDSGFFVYQGRFTLGKIENYEDFIKSTLSYKIIKDVLKTKWFNIGVSHDLSLNKSFTFNRVSPDNEEHHVLSSFECYSKLLGINILSKEGIVDNGYKLYLQSNNSIRVKNIKWFQANDLLSRIEPYFGMEYIYNPSKSNELKKCLTSIFSLGFSLKLNDLVFLDFIFYSWSINSYINHNQVNRFRLNLEISTNL